MPDPEREKEYKRQYYRKTIEHQKEYKRQYYLKNKERINQKHREYNRINAERLNEYQREYYKRTRIPLKVQRKEAEEKKKLETKQLIEKEELLKAEERVRKLDDKRNRFREYQREFYRKQREERRKSGKPRVTVRRINAKKKDTKLVSLTHKNKGKPLIKPDDNDHGSKIVIY